MLVPDAKIILDPVQVNCGPSAPRAGGRLVMIDNCLAGVLVRLEADQQEFAGKWSLDAVFRIDIAPPGPLFDTLDDAVAWIREHLT